MNRPIYVIAEVGINHNGSIENARALLHGAAKSQANAVKFQYRNVDRSYITENHMEIGDEILKEEIVNTHIAPGAILELKNYAQNLGLDVGISFFCVEDMEDFGENISDFDFFKLPSVEMLNFNLISSFCNLGKKVFISTGCSNESELEALNQNVGHLDYSLLHCVSNYPLLAENSKLGYIEYLKTKWTKPVGYSSHDENWEVCLLACMLGAEIIERHITLNKFDPGLDHSSSSTIEEFEKLVFFCKNLNKIITGNSPRTPNQGEYLNSQNLGRGLYLNKNVSPGDFVTESDLIYRSPKVGISFTELESFLKKPLINEAKKGSALKYTNFITRPILSSSVQQFCAQNKVALPIRFHDYQSLQKAMPTNNYELHLSAGELLSIPDLEQFSGENNYSIHIPDYINSLTLINPFSDSKEVQAESKKCIERVKEIAFVLKKKTNNEVPIVGSFSLRTNTRENFFEKQKEFLDDIKQEGIEIYPQWLPPIAWYFGGSVRLDLMNSEKDLELLKKTRTNYCLDICHAIMGENYGSVEAEFLFQETKKLVKHIHLAEAKGFDGEGVKFGENGEKYFPLFAQLINENCMKVVEVWQGHLNDGIGFFNALNQLKILYDKHG